VKDAARNEAQRSVLILVTTWFVFEHLGAFPEGISRREINA